MVAAILTLFVGVPSASAATKGLIREPKVFKAKVQQLHQLVEHSDWKGAGQLIQTIAKAQDLAGLLSRIRGQSAIVVAGSQAGTTYRVGFSPDAPNLKTINKVAARLGGWGFGTDTALRLAWASKLFRLYDSQLALEISKRESGRAAEGVWVTIGSAYGKGSDHIAIIPTSRPAISIARARSDFGVHWNDARGGLLLHKDSYELIDTPSSVGKQRYLTALSLFAYLADLADTPGRD